MNLAFEVPEQSKPRVLALFCWFAHVCAPDFSILITPGATAEASRQRCRLVYRCSVSVSGLGLLDDQIRTMCSFRKQSAG